ncbi:DUF802 domain-containing protein [Limnohabitans sp. 63ED37-2]|uniref:DUF802 domain-containing protein n=1 Tax=Limnohabitans sp. 63ED37-2 TaxID=1678128 RepID=UPI000705BDC5|nr:DUF802 domain-containing protein [Limnohabitans sp. 63ED37-2]ALK88789.1 hypothetical protein L63ED372_01582 [Limnohabitans sp. 63ED37-2]
MKRFSFSIAFGLGALALIWVAAAVASSHFLVLVMTLLIGAVYGFGAWELRQYRATTTALDQGLTQVPADLVHLSDWVLTLPLALQNPVRQRVQGERVALPGPVFTPYLVGLLVMLGMLGTFLGMVVTLNGAVFALEGTNTLAGVRAAFSEPIKGLGLAFGTSVAGVASSAMLGLMSSLARRERALSSQHLDTLAHTQLQRFSLAHQRQESYLALQQQAQALPQVLQQLQALMAQMASNTELTHTQLLTSQHSFQEKVQQEVHKAYTGLAQSVDQSLRTSLSQSLQLATDSIRPVVQATMTQLTEQAKALNDRLLHNTQLQLGEVHTQLTATATTLAQTSAQTLSQHEQTNQRMSERVGQTLEAFSQNFERSAQALVVQVGSAQAAQHAQQSSADQQRLESWQTALNSMADGLQQQWQTSGTQTLAQQQAICDTLARTAQDISTHSQTQATQTLADITRLLASSEALVQTRIAAEAQWTAQHSQRAEELSALLRQELTALRQAEDERGQAAVARLAELQSTVTAHLSTLGTALEAPITRLIETASEAPKAAAEVIGQLRQEISVSVARDNALLEERTRILGTLSTLLDAINHASTEQRGVIDALLVSSQASLMQTSEQFQQHVAKETDKLGGIAAQVTASAVDVASLGESLGFAVRAFGQTNEQLMAQLQRIEQALDKSMTRSDEQLAYYVAQAREIIDLSIGSQKDVLDALQRRTDLVSEGAI